MAGTRGRRTVARGRAKAARRRAEVEPRANARRKSVTASTVETREKSGCCMRSPKWMRKVRSRLGGGRTSGQRSCEVEGRARAYGDDARRMRMRSTPTPKRTRDARVRCAAGCGDSRRTSAKATSFPKYLSSDSRIFRKPQTEYSCRGDISSRRRPTFGVDEHKQILLTHQTVTPLVSWRGFRKLALDTMREQYTVTS